MAISEIIRTERLNVVPFSRHHLTEKYVGWLNDKLIMRFSERRHRTFSLESCREYFFSFKDTPHYFWAIEEIQSNLGHIGNLNAYIDVNNSVADLGILIGEIKARNQSYGLEAWIGVCDYLFGKATRKITAGALAVNKPMIRLMERSGMIEDGVRRRHYLWEGHEVDVIHMALFNDKWDLT